MEVETAQVESLEKQLKNEFPISPPNRLYTDIRETVDFGGDYGLDDALEDVDLDSCEGLGRESPSLHDAIYRFVERTNLWLRTRWAVFCVLLLAFICRVIVHHGFYIISYAYGIYFLNLSLSFLSPLEDMEEKEYEGEEEERDEYRPFVRRLPEFKYWFYATEWVCISSFLTCFEIFNLPVFWPILVGYFCILVFITMKDRIKHMIKFGYVPWSAGKKRYGRRVRDVELGSKAEDLV